MVLNELDKDLVLKAFRSLEFWVRCCIPLIKEAVK